jgi:hypothetical protein
MKNMSIVPQQRKDFILETLTFFLGRLFSSILNTEFFYLFSNLLYFFVVSGAAVGSTVAAIPEHGARARGSGGTAGECSREIWQHAPTPPRVRPYLTTLTLF